MNEAKLLQKIISLEITEAEYAKDFKITLRFSDGIT